MPTLRILVPDSTTNYVKNPSIRFDTTGWVAGGSAISRSLNYARFGIASLSINTNGAVLYEGAYYRISWLSGTLSPITASAYVRGAGYVRIRLTDNLSGREWYSDTIRIRSDRWQRISASGLCSGGDDVRVYIETAQKTQDITFYVDGVQVEPHPYETTYCDGDQPGCSWQIYQHGSVSTRPQFTRLGGKWFDLIGPEQEEDLYLTVIGGFGMPPILNNIQAYTLAPGSFYQSTKVLDRIVTIAFHAKNDVGARNCNDISLEKLHALRQMLIDVLKPDKTRGGEEFVLEYSDGTIPVYLRARYDGGIEGEWDIRNQWVNSFAVRFLCVSPYLFEDNQDIFSLNFRETQTVNYVAQRFDGAWGEMNGGTNTVVSDFKIGKRGEVIACGAFNKANNKITAIDPEIFANFICYWDGTQWQKYGTGANNTINAVAVGPNGNVYATGSFTSIGGVAANRIAYWNGATWVALGSGIGNGAGFCVEVAADGDVYVGGSFTQAGGKNCYYIARWDGVDWQTVGNEHGMNNSVYALAITPDGYYVYVGGAFTDEYGSPANIDANYAAVYIPSINQFDSLGKGLNGTVRDMALAQSGRLYAGGDFTETDEGDPILYVGFWNGSAWYPMGAGANGTVRALSVCSEKILACGDFTRLGSENASYVGLWNGSAWVNIDIAPRAACYAVSFGEDCDTIFLSTNGTIVDFAKITTVENTGTGEVSPVLYIQGPCTVKWVENQTTKKRLFADMEILDDEEVFVEFNTGKVISSVRGNLAWAISPGSDMREWMLTPGNNKISVLMTQDVGAIAYLYYQHRHWSADATALQEQ